MTEIHELGHAHGIAVIEDCAQAHGAHLQGQCVSGEVTTNRADLWDAMWAFKHHGKTLRRLSGATASRAFGYGSNLRFSELQSAIGRIQL